ncbi:MAG: hypothetical protein A3I75_06615 [Deltaproteobacteria bacterium RIFCSPLOWO2_02_FULL_50_16]|nr:MAG: hypothetical protein A2053_02510 [Deltaproteobacteria bacterium GWA2_50_8]OGQ26720.1 MAG: hypothetical protein A3B79_04950 [Deltaproteobacteria bacterium RIFCSPHIGHO2_02_FULL_50_15]OGQ55513.1 MAG: hypothetical protein A3I75_06615 [Deltaproteobacteria bacterium RIFCSPLOWO2_02_FULL_50_16]OGQ68990.1 MAG: hypothetical protein A3F89_04365 [Deltaproteobacteria bacterium RIFCSPLOWO2_12_FULL_50_11]
MGKSHKYFQTSNMRKTITVFFVMGFCLFFAGNNVSADEARALMEKVERERSNSGEIEEMNMSLLDSQGNVRMRTVTYYNKQKKPGSKEDMRLVRFHSPADMDGSGVLTIENNDRDNDQWMYSPAYHTTRRVPPSNRGNRYMGTDYAYEDIMDQKTHEYEYAIIGKETMNGIPCTLLQSVPIEPKLVKETKYSKTLWWIDPVRHITAQIDFFDKSGNLFKRMSTAQLKPYGNHWRFDKVTIEDFSRNHKTVNEIIQRKIDQEIPDYYFTERFLKREK